MGEYANYRGQSIKIGTCEDMYYLRFDQRFAVHRETGNVDPVADRGVLRFRFPWPSEDGIAPGAFDPAYKLVTIPGLTAPAGVEHGSVQFRAEAAGYLVSLPCPEGLPDNAPGLTAGTIPGTAFRIGRNGFRGAVQLVAQRYLEASDRLVPVFRCGGCDRMWREEEDARIEETAMLCRAEADRRATDSGASAAEFWHGVADRLLAGAAIGAGVYFTWSAIEHIFTEERAS
ncbi:MAG TPA: hypothetical protein VN903_17690 [Polyangia bacterium]|nr:hypothetical protein [Polyangia bacterium]